MIASLLSGCHYHPQPSLHPPTLLGYLTALTAGGPALRYKPDDVAGWLLHVLDSVGTIDRAFHVLQAASYFGAEFRILDAERRPTFTPAVLEALDRLSGGRSVWDAQALAWRWRRPDDAPAAAPTIVWHPKDWATIMVSTAHDECLVYRRVDRVDGAEGIALRVSGQDHEWTEAGRQAFAGIDAPAAIYVEVTTGTARRRFTTVHEYQQPGLAPSHGTPAPKALHPR